jgi:hypothetical protein
MRRSAERTLQDFDTRETCSKPLKHKESIDEGRIIPFTHRAKGTEHAHLRSTHQCKSI